MTSIFRSTAVCALILGAAAVLCAESLYPRMGPPPALAEAIPAVPAAHPMWVWRAGYYRWHNTRYAWVPGAYVRPPHPGYRWYAGHWRQNRDRWVWVQGRWR